MKITHLFRCNHSDCCNGKITHEVKVYCRNRYNNSTHMIDKFKLCRECADDYKRESYLWAVYDNMFPKETYEIYASISRLKHEDKEYESFLRDFILAVRNELSFKSRYINTKGTEGFADFIGYDEKTLNTAVKNVFEEFIGKHY